MMMHPNLKDMATALTRALGHWSVSCHSHTPGKRLPTSQCIVAAVLFLKLRT
jgi:hypothetical protein